MQILVSCDKLFTGIRCCMEVMYVEAGVWNSQIGILLYTQKETMKVWRSKKDDRVGVEYEI